MTDVCWCRERDKETAQLFLCLTLTRMALMVVLCGTLTRMKRRVGMASVKHLIIKCRPR